MKFWIIQVYATLPGNERRPIYVHVVDESSGPKVNTESVTQRAKEADDEANATMSARFGHDVAYQSVVKGPFLFQDLPQSL